MIDYCKRLVEVDEILSYLSEKELQKIPEKIRQAIKDNKDKEYVWKYDTSKELKDQELDRNTIAILSYLNMEYLLDEEQKKLMQQIHDFNEKKQEEEKREKYNVDNLFKKDKIIQEENEKQKSLVEYNVSFFAKIITKIKSFFAKNKNND